MYDDKEQKLTRLLSDNDYEKAYEVIVDIYSSFIHKMIWEKNIPSSEHRDAFQTIMLYIFQRINEYNPDRKVGTMTYIYNLILGGIKKYRTTEQKYFSRMSDIYGDEIEENYNDETSDIEEKIMNENRMRSIKICSSLYNMSSNVPSTKLRRKARFVKKCKDLLLPIRNSI